MPRDGNIMAEAIRRFQADKERRAAQLERRTEEIYRRVPAVQAIDRQLQATAARIVLAAFEQDGDPDAALKRLEEGNLALQRERAELLVGAGYPYNYLDDGPRPAGAWPLTTPGSRIDGSASCWIWAANPLKPFPWRGILPRSGRNMDAAHRTI